MLYAEPLVNIEFSAGNGTPDLIHHRLVRSPFVPFVNRFGQDDSKLGKGPLLSELMCGLRVDKDSVHVKYDRCDLRLCFQMGVDSRQVCSVVRLWVVYFLPPLDLALRVLRSFKFTLESGENSLQDT